MFLICIGLDAEPIKHRFLAIDEGKCNLLYVDEYDASKNWIVQVQNDSPRDMQLIGNNLVLIGHDKGYSEYDITTGKLVKDVTSFNFVTSARRLPNGNTLITRSYMDKTPGIFVLEVNPKNEVISKVIFPGDYVRLVRHTAKGTYLLACDKAIIEGDAKGKVLMNAPVEKFSHAWKAVRLSNGNILSSGGYGPFMVELNPAGKVIRKFGTKEELPAEVEVNFYATFQLLANGNIVICNWEGHGDGHGAKGIQIFELDNAGKIVWKWSDSKIISSMQGVMILDGVDTKVLNDERNGIVAPIAVK